MTWKPAWSSIIGYPYQHQVYAMLVAKMDVDNDYKSIAIEKILSDSDKDKFDDCYVEYKSEKFQFQVKNLEKNKQTPTIDDIVIDDDNVSVFSTKIPFKKENTKILVLFTDKIKTNTQILGLNAIKKGEVFIVPLTIYDIGHHFDELYQDERRIRTIIDFALDKTTSRVFKIDREDLPDPENIFSIELDDETILLRNTIEKLETGIQMVIGKPGVGKSHFVNELTEYIKPNSVYRFWISSLDKDSKKRLQFNDFFKQVCIDIFKSHGHFSYEDLVNEINSKGLTVIIDGLDHIENYNPAELEKYIKFIEDCSNGKILVLSRPLKQELEWDKIYLENWDFNETRGYLYLNYGVDDFNIVEKIYNASEGYPIITKFISEHYLEYDEIPDSTFSDINEYYEVLLDGENVKSPMSIFLMNSYFILKEELILFLGEFSCNIIEEFINNHPYLFNIDLNRISLIHDSLNTYLKENNETYELIEEDVLSEVQNSIKNFEINYLSRFNGFNFDEGFVKDILILYSSFESFKKLLGSSFDVESIQEFYSQLELVLYQLPNLLDIEQYYSFILISLILKRVDFKGYYHLLCQSFIFMDNNSINEKQIFSKGTFWNSYKYFKFIKFGDIRYLLFLKDLSDYEKRELYTDFEDEYHYWENMKNFDESEIVENIKLTDNQHRKSELLIDLLVKIKFNQNNDSKYYFIIKNYLNNNYIICDEDFKQLCVDFNLANDLKNHISNRLKFEFECVGIITDDKPFLNNDINQLILMNSSKGSYSVESYLLRYLRLKNYRKEYFNLTQINAFYCMYFAHKDFSVISIPNALLTFEDKNFISSSDSINLIIKLMNQSEDGIEGLLEDYINLKNSLFIKSLLMNKKFPWYLVNIFNLKPELINEFPIEYIHLSLNKILKYYSPGASIDYLSVVNVFKSKYCSEIVSFINSRRYLVENVPRDEISVVDGKIEYSIKKDEDYIPLKGGIISMSDLDYIKENNLSCIEISQYFDGWYFAFHYLELYNHYTNEILQKECLNIIHNSMFVKVHTYFNRWDYFLGNLPLFLDKIEYDVDWEEIYDILKSFLTISLISY